MKNRRDFLKKAAALGFGSAAFSTAFAAQNPSWNNTIISVQGDSVDRAPSKAISQDIKNAKINNLNKSKYKTLLLFAHTYWQDSVLNRALLAALSKDIELSKTTLIRNISEIYPNGRIKMENEHAALESCEELVVQFPLFWYSVPSLLKEWQDIVLTGLLRGRSAPIRDKRVRFVFTAGAPKRFYDALTIQHLSGPSRIIFPLYLAFSRAHARPDTEPFVVYENATQNAINEYLEFLKA